MQLQKCWPNFTTIIKILTAQSLSRTTNPTPWSGGVFNVGLYKDRRLLVVEKDVRVQRQVSFLLKPELIFAVTHNGYARDRTFTAAEISEQSTFNLLHYLNGIVVTLKQTCGGGYFFSAAALEPR